jgi:hypothetical protein|tara:strand:- start:2374 stop:2955 length:582 start_codon:yes stop_codon:yes gene_type:complete
MQTEQSYLNKARKDKFMLVFDLPPILKPIARKFQRDNKVISPDSVQFSIFGTMVPEIVVKGSESRYAGSTLYTSTHSKDSYPPVNIKFNVDSMYNNYYAIYSWLNLLHDEKTGVYNQAGLVPDDVNFNDYQTDLTVYGLDEFGKKRISFKYTKAFPTSIDGIEYDQQGSDGEEIISGFTFLYSQMHVEILSEI